MDLDLSEEDQMMRAIAMSLGENVLMSTDSANSTSQVNNQDFLIILWKRVALGANLSCFLFNPMLGKILITFSISCAHLARFSEAQTVIV